MTDDGIVPAPPPKAPADVPPRLKALTKMTKAMLEQDEDDRAWVLKRLTELLWKRSSNH